MIILVLLELESYAKNNESKLVERLNLERVLQEKMMEVLKKFFVMFVIKLKKI